MTEYNYTQALVACSVNRCMSAVCPLAFGEVDVKARVKAVMNYRKPAFWIIPVSIAACVVVAVCFLTNPRKDHFTLRIVVPAGSQEAVVYADEEISPLGNHITVSSGDGLGDTEVSLKTVQVKTETAYDEPAYLTPGMPVRMTAEKGGWFKIGVNIQNDTDEDKIVYLNVENVEVRISSQSNATMKWFDYTEDSSDMPWDNELKIQIDEFPDITFQYTPYEIIATTSREDGDRNGNTILITGMPIWNAYFTDLTGDGLPEICSEVSFGSGIIDNHVIIFDYANRASYKLADRGYHDYFLRMNDTDGCLYVDKKRYNSDELVSSGKLVFKDGCIQLEGMNAELTTILQAKLLEINNGYFLVEPVEGSWERNSVDKIEIPMENMSPSPEPQVGDILQIEYDGQIQETYPARISNPYSIKVVKETANDSILDVFKSRFSDDETITVIDYVYADDEAYGLDGIVQYADETSSPWKLAFIRDGVAYTVSQGWGTDYIIASELTYLGNGAVRVYIENTKNGVFYESIIRYSYDAESANAHYEAKSKEVEAPD